MTSLDERPRNESDMLEQARIAAERAFAARTPATRGVVWWASAIAVTALGTITFAFVYSYYYLRLGADQWPLEGSELRTWEVPALALGAVIVGLFVGPGAARGRLALAAGGGLAAVGLVLQLWALLAAGYAVDANAYEALVITIDALAALLLATALAIRVAAVSFEWPRRGPNALHEADAAFFVGFCSIWIAVWMVLHLSPRVL